MRLDVTQILNLVIGNKIPNTKTRYGWTVTSQDADAYLEEHCTMRTEDIEAKMEEFLYV